VLQFYRSRLAEAGKSEGLGKQIALGNSREPLAVSRSGTIRDDTNLVGSSSERAKAAPRQAVRCVACLSISLLNQRSDLIDIGWRDQTDAGVLMQTRDEVLLG
jgi:hypothetical protein